MIFFLSIIFFFLLIFLDDEDTGFVREEYPITNVIDNSNQEHFTLDSDSIKQLFFSTSNSSDSSFSFNSLPHRPTKRFASIVALLSKRTTSKFKVSSSRRAADAKTLPLGASHTYAHGDVSFT